MEAAISRASSNGCSTSPVDIHFWIYADVTNNGGWASKEKSPFSSLLRPFYFGPLYLSHETKRDCKGTSEEHMKQNKTWLPASYGEKNMPKVKSTVASCMPSEWRRL